jgi:hypothetical protein
MPDWMPSTSAPAKNVAMSSAVGELNPAKPIELTIGTAITNKIAMARKRCRCSHQHSVSAPTVPPTCSAAPASAAVPGETCAAPIKVGVQLIRKK